MAKNTGKEGKLPKRTVDSGHSEELKQKILKIAKFGFSESDTALLVKISAAELKKMLKADSEFGRDYKKAELEAQLEAEAAFHSRACGYQTIEVTYVYIPSADNSTDDKDAAGITNTNSDDESQELILHSETICGNGADIKSEIRRIVEAGLNLKLKEVRFAKNSCRLIHQAAAPGLITAEAKGGARIQSAGATLISRNLKGSGR